MAISVETTMSLNAASSSGGDFGVTAMGDEKVGETAAVTAPAG